MAKPKPKVIETWNSEECEACGYFFDLPGWESDWSMSGELVWICPKCRKENFEPIE